VICFSLPGETPRSLTRLHGSSRYSDSFGTQRDSTDLLKKPKITKRFAKEEGEAEGEKNNLTRLADSRRSLPRDELRSTDSQKSISGVRRRTYRIKPIDKSKESLEAEESAHGLAARTPATVSTTVLASSSAEKLLLQSMSSDNKDLRDENKVVNSNNKASERLEVRENETDLKNETEKDEDFKNEKTEASESPLKANTTATTTTTTEIPISTSVRKRRPSAFIRSETPASPLPAAAALTMSESLYNHFRPLDKEVPEDHLLPFLDFGKKLTPVSAKTTSPVAGSSSSTSSTNSIEATGTSPRTPALRQYNLLNSTPQKVLPTNPRVTHVPREDEIHEDMDVSVVKSIVEKNKASRSRGNALQFLRNLGGLYRKHGTSTSEIVADPSTTNSVPASSTENPLIIEEATKNNSDVGDNNGMKLGSVNTVSTPSNSTEYPPTSQGLRKNSYSISQPTTEASVYNHSTNFSSHTTEPESRRNSYESSPNSDISEQLAVSSTSQSGFRTQLPASSSHVEATVPTPFVRVRPSPTAKSIYSFPFANRRPPPSIHLHFNRNSNIASKLLNPSRNIPKPENISLHSERKTPEKGVNLADFSITSGAREKSALTRTPWNPLHVSSATPNFYAGKKEFVNDSATEYEPKANVSEPVNSEEELVVNPEEQYAQMELRTNNDGSLYEDAVNNSGENISSQTSVESVTAKLVTSTSPRYGQTNITVPTEAPPFTSSIQSPTTKILSTAVVTSVSVKGAWPVMITDTPPLEPTLVLPESYRSQDAKNDSLEHVLGPPERRNTNQTQSKVKETATPQTHHLTVSSNGTLSHQFPRKIVATNTSSNSNLNSTDLRKEINVASKNPEFTTSMKVVISNRSNNITHIINNYGENNTSVNKSVINLTPTAGEGAVSVARNAKSDGLATKTPAASTDSPPLADSHGRGVTYPPTSSAFTSKSVTRNPVPRLSTSSTDMPRALLETTRTKDVTHTLSENGTREGHVQDTSATSSQVTMKSLAPDSEFDFPLLKLYNSSTIWSLPARAVTRSSNESRKFATEHPETGNGSTEVTNHTYTMINVTETSTQKISIVGDVTKAAEVVNTSSGIYEGEGRNDATEKDTKEKVRPSKGADVHNNASAVSNGAGNVSRNATLGSPRPGENSELLQSATIALYVVAALGIVLLTVGVAFAARYCVQRRRKVSYIPGEQASLQNRTRSFAKSCPICLLD
jgi:hypothetical protein